METIVPGKYRHSRLRKEYRVLGIALHSETLEPMVVYEALYENEKSKLWVRPIAMWFELVEVDGKMVPRFVKIEE